MVSKQPGGVNDDQKALTCVLLDERGRMVAFGEKARRDYAEADDGMLRPFLLVWATPS